MPVVGTTTTQTVSDIVEQVRTRLMGSIPGRINILNAAISSTEDLLVLKDDVSGISPGSIIEVGIEQMYVRDVQSDVNAVTVLRGWAGTETGTHSENSIVRVAPSYSTQEIFNAVLDEFSALNGTGLVAHETCEFTYNGTDSLYDTGLDTTSRVPLYVQEAKYEERQTVDRWRPTKVDLIKGLDRDDFESGYAFYPIERPRTTTARGSVATSRMTLVRVTVATTFARPQALESEVSEAALCTGFSVVPIVAVGAAWRLLLTKESQRLNPDSSHGSRRAEEIAPGSISFLARALQGQKNDLIENARESQYQKYPPRQNL